MKIVTCELHKVALAALVLGLFSVSPSARADQPKFDRFPAASSSLVASVIGDDADPGALDSSNNVAAAPAAAPAAKPAASAAVPAMASSSGLVSLARPQDDSGLISATANDSGGMSLNRLRTASPLADFKVSLVGDVLQVNGTIPRKCAIGASVTVASFSESEGTAAHHEIKIVPGAGCDKLSTADQNDLVALNSPALFGNGRGIPDTSIDGEICIAHSANGLKACDKIDGLRYVSEATKSKAASAKLAAEESKRQKDRQQAFVDKLNLLCKQGDYVGFGKEIDAKRELLGDVSGILTKMDGLKQKFMAAQITKAKDVDGVNDAYQAYLDAAESAGWDTDEVTSKFVDKRVDMMNEIAKDNSKSTSERAAAIRDLTSDLKDLDLFDKEHKGHIGAAYMDLANSLKDSGSTDDVAKFDEAARFYNEALQFATAEQKVTIDVQIEKMYSDAANQCLIDSKEAGKGAKIAVCQSLQAKAKKEMDVAMKAQKQVHNDGSLAALNAMKRDKIARFGQDGAVAVQNINGYDGSSVSVNFMGGSWDASVYQTFTQTQQSFLQQMMQGQQRAPSGVAGGSVF